MNANTSEGISSSGGRSDPAGGSGRGRPEGNQAEGDDDTMYSPFEVFKKTPTSLCWKFFEFKKKGGVIDHSRVYCKLCEGERKRQGVPFKNSTTNPMHHLRFYHHEEYSQAEAEATRTEKSKEKQGPMDVYLNKPTTKWSKTSDKWKQTTMAIAKWCVKDTRPNFNEQIIAKRCLLPSSLSQNKLFRKNDKNKTLCIIPATAEYKQIQVEAPQRPPCKFCMLCRCSRVEGCLGK